MAWTITELIEKLQEDLEKYGDLPVISDDTGKWIDIEVATFPNGAVCINVVWPGQKVEEEE